jgi:hypothetical protein
LHDTDVPHLVIGRPADVRKSTLRLFLPGTFSDPAAASCLLDAISEGGLHPTLGLSYIWLNRTDAERNELCRSAHPGQPDDVARCLMLGHKDAVFGGESEPGLWQGVAAHEAIVGRLVSLLRYLHKTDPTAGWSKFLKGSSDTLDWPRIIVGGHSQGAGHAAFLAQQVPAAAAALLSGPQVCGCAPHILIPYS